jgi:TonB family protein
MGMASDPKANITLIKRLRPTPGETGTAPRLLHKVHAQYTQEARNKGIEGVVVLSIIVDKGSAKSIRVLKSLDPGLDEAAMNAVRTWRFQPGTKSGQPVDVETRIEVSFSLKKQPADGSPDAWDTVAPPAVTPTAPVITSPASSTVSNTTKPTGEAAKHPNAVEPLQPAPSNKATPPLLLHKVEPEYTPVARDKGIQGDVYLYIVADRNGLSGAARKGAISGG